MVINNMIITNVRMTSVFKLSASPVLELTDAGVPPEDVPVEDVEGEVAEAARDLTIEVFTIERAEDKEGTEGRFQHLSEQT